MKQKESSLYIFILGIIFALSGAIIMFEGNIFGDRTIGVAIILGILGIGLIAGSSPRKRKK
jgi:hypothetical protein